LQAWLIEKDFMISYYYINYLHVSWNIFLAPAFYLFLVNYLRIEKRLKNIFLITVIVFILTIILRILSLKYIKPQFDTSHFYSFLRKYNTFEDIFVFIYTIPIFLFSVYVFFKQRHLFKFVLSYDNLKWIKSFFVLCSIILFFWLVAIFLNYHFTTVNTSYFYSPLRFGTSFLIYWLGYQGFNQYKLMQGRITLRAEIKNDNSVITFDSNVQNTNNGKELETFNKLKQHLIETKSYLNPYLSLSSLAIEFGTNTSTLSKLINTYSSYNFTDFINDFRIKSAKKLLSDKHYNLYTIVAIGLECGFNSKSTFYTAFKKFTKQTPTQFRKDNSSKK
jgi:AraC-like DNA-binding protein